MNSINEYHTQPVYPLALSGLIVTAALALSADPLFALLIIAGFLIQAIWLARGDLSHPLVWLLPFIYIYHYSVVILHVSDLRWSSQIGPVIWIGWLSIVSAALVFAGFCKVKSNVDSRELRFRVPISSIAIAIGYWLFFALTIAQCVMFLRSGFADKVEANVYGSGVAGFNFAAVWMLVLYVLWFLKKQSRDDRFPWWLVITTGLLALFVTLAIGERDVVLRFGLVTMLLIYIRYRPPFWVVGTLGLALVFMIPILGSLRSVFTREVTLAQDLPLVQAVLFDEFISTGRNIEILLDHYQWWDYFFGQTLLWDALRTFVPGIFIASPTAGSWFNNTFLPHIVASGQGYGFTLSGEGFINFGYPGVVLFYGLMALLVAYLFNRRFRDGIYLTIFLSMIPFVIYTTRGDLSCITSPLLKSVLLPIAMVFVLDQVLRFAGLLDRLRINHMPTRRTFVRGIPR